jgi:hypothetical protein
MQLSNYDVGAALLMQTIDFLVICQFATAIDNFTLGRICVYALSKIYHFKILSH